MHFTTTMTQKGQITIPKQLRGLLNIYPRTKIRIEVKKQGLLRLKPAEQLSDLAGSVKVKKPIDPVKIRAYMEKNYTRS
jgi:AbrB family looped-hinge helix DNA binding protein